ncbi:hypothetical protein RND81_10G230800 [Saponaria officinalis]|uniref:LOB domain-containing protein n=1 Tax=Saponaria officinalis TaxID=3572 RepID=A0AAW1I5X8_SAPOF
MASSSSYNSPCAACKFLRRKCMPGCIFAPYFPPEEPHKFANVHKIFGASNVTKLLNDVLPHQREDAVNSLAYEAEARVRDPVYGCVGAISYLQRQVHRLQKELDVANADLIRYACHDIQTPPPPPPRSDVDQFGSFYNASDHNNIVGLGNFSSTTFPSFLPWNNENIDPRGGGVIDDRHQGNM